MKMNFRKPAVAALALLTLAALAALAGCGNVSSKVGKDGRSAGELVWPKIGDTTPMHRGGTWPSLDNLRLVQAGQNKNQVARLIGYPHFSEGVFGVREWNYVFHFRTADDPDLVCQYKVLFDENKLAQSFYWSPASCADVLKPAAKSAAKVERFNLSADALFAFDKSALGDVKPEGRVQLNRLAKKLLSRGDKVGAVSVLGYTDRLGSDDYNRQLSQQRADTVKAYLVEQGVPSGIVTAEGRGKDAAVATDCHQAGRAELIACLAPNRRVEVDVAGK